MTHIAILCYYKKNKKPFISSRLGLDRRGCSMLSTGIDKINEHSGCSLDLAAAGLFDTFCNRFIPGKKETLVMAKVSPAQFVRQVRQEVSRIS